MYEALSTSKVPTEPLHDVTSDVADTGLADAYLSAPKEPTDIPIPPLQPAKNQTQTHPPSRPKQERSKDPLSLAQLRRLVTEYPKLDTVSYAFTYDNTADFEEEINEWFSYSEAEYSRLLHAKQKFESRWKKFGKNSWLESDTNEHLRFTEKEVAGLLESDLRHRCKSLHAILHIVLGVWDVTAPLGFLQGNTNSITKASPGHLNHIKRGIDLLARVKAIPIIFDVLQDTFRKLGNKDHREPNFEESDLPFLHDQLNSVTTIFYLIIEAIRTKDTSLKLARDQLTIIAPDVVNYFLKITSSLRWEEFSDWPQTKIILLFWKSILFLFGGVNEVNNLKKNIVVDEHIHDGEKIITASPLDYHIFRQEIMSKYPAYIPPQPLIPLEPDTFTILPPLPNRSRRRNGSNNFISPALNISSSGASILHQPVHIATPAPSPPPSPPVGGKAGKKQNYQTNQNFPFMYPPLDNTSCSAGGKGLAGLQEKLVGRNWEGSDIPKSILEAGSLFSQRMRMTRAMRQLWEEREKYIKFERGWDADDIIEELNIDPTLATEIPDSETKKAGPESKHEPNDKICDELRKKLNLIESFYKVSLPCLQSLVIVLMRVILANVTAKMALRGEEVQSLMTRLKEVATRSKESQNQDRVQEPIGITPPNPEPPEPMVEELMACRSREINTKAVSGIILLLLKWFRVSHVLKFEYLAQLLLDSNYFSLILRYFNHHDIEKDINNKIDRDEMNFFAFCNLNSIKAVPEEEIHTSDTPHIFEDDAIPPPIKRGRKFMAYFETLGQPGALPNQDEHIPAKVNTMENTEANSGTDSQPKVITDFSWRIMFSSVNLIRILQKLCKMKTHRILLLVQYKYSNTLKKLLKIPQSDLHIYTLKVFKNQVPYCGRKWRQGNMRIITAIYLHCRPELRDDWLAGCDIVADMEEALPLEQALRALTHWYNIKHYPDQMGTNTKLQVFQYDFFVRQLEMMEINDENISEPECENEAAWECVSNNGW